MIIGGRAMSLFKGFESMDPVLSRELLRYLLAAGAVLAAMCLLVFKAAALPFIEGLRTRLMGRRGRHDQLRRT